MPPRRAGARSAAGGRRGGLLRAAAPHRAGRGRGPAGSRGGDGLRARLRQLPGAAELAAPQRFWGAPGERGHSRVRETSAEGAPFGPSAAPSRAAVRQQSPSAENGRTKGGGGSGAPAGIQGPRYPAPPSDTFGFSPSQRRHPRDPGPASGAAASARLPLGLCVSLCVCLRACLRFHT